MLATYINMEPGLSFVLDYVNSTKSFICPLKSLTLAEYLTILVSRKNLWMGTGLVRDDPTVL